jgi:hypothetical protein
MLFQEGLVKSNMDKLTFFAMKSPEKLDRIGEYLAQRLSRDVYRQRYGYEAVIPSVMMNVMWRHLFQDMSTLLWKPWTIFW